MTWILIAFYIVLIVEQLLAGNYPKASYWFGATWITLSVHWMK